MHVCMCVHTCIHAYVCIYIDACIHKCAIYLNNNIYIYIYVHKYLYTDMCVWDLSVDAITWTRARLVSVSCASFTRPNYAGDSWKTCVFPQFQIIWILSFPIAHNRVGTSHGQPDSLSKIDHWDDPMPRQYPSLENTNGLHSVWKQIHTCMLDCDWMFKGGNHKPQDLNNR